MLETLKEYAGKRLELLKLEASEKSGLAAGTITYIVICLVALFFMIILLNIGLGLLIGYYLNNYAYGVLIMAGFYLLIILITLLARKPIRNLVANKIIKSLN